jgi:uncharacterized protein (DUF3084 family)
MTITATETRVQDTSKPQASLDNNIAKVRGGVQALDIAIDQLVRSLEALVDDEDTPESVRALAADMRSEAEPVRDTFDHGDFPGLLDGLEALAAGEDEDDAGDAEV